LAEENALGDRVFLQTPKRLPAEPAGRLQKTRCAFPQWLLLLMDVLSGCLSATDLNHFARRHHQASPAALDFKLLKAPCDSTLIYLFERVELEHFFAVLRQWMVV
jgi:hypothetical protein